MLNITAIDSDELGPELAATASRGPGRYLWGSNTIEAIVAATSPAILTLLADGVPRSRRTIIQALASTHAKEDVKCTLMRMAVTDRLGELSGRYTLPTEGLPIGR